MDNLLANENRFEMACLKAHLSEYEEILVGGGTGDNIEDLVPGNARQQTAGYTIAPAVKDHICFFLLMKDHNTDDLRTELTHRGIHHRSTDNFTKLKQLLAEDELTRMPNVPSMEDRIKQSSWYTKTGYPKYFKKLSHATFQIHKTLK